jgi:hypothetical protein
MFINSPGSPPKSIWFFVFEFDNSTLIPHETTNLCTFGHSKSFGMQQLLLFAARNPRPHQKQASLRQDVAHLSLWSLSGSKESGAMNDQNRLKAVEDMSHLAAACLN